MLKKLRSTALDEQIQMFPDKTNAEITITDHMQTKYKNTIYFGNTTIDLDLDVYCLRVEKNCYINENKCEMPTQAIKIYCSKPFSKIRKEKSANYKNKNKFIKTTLFVNLAEKTFNLRLFK